ncbi:MAG: tyrosine-type recombinase/integrase [Magnetococcales bacterium]|nr:tyrosine-type recombinase/integrase [Magnetococcales bacterium]
MQRLLHAVESPIHSTLFALMYACGLRISEAQKLTIPDINSTNGTLRIIGKCNKERHVPLPTPTLESLRGLWKTHRHPQLLFPNQMGEQPVATCVLYRTFKDAIQKAGLPHTFSPHVLRHSYATRGNLGTVYPFLFQIEKVKMTHGQNRSRCCSWIATSHHPAWQSEATDLF